MKAGRQSVMTLVFTVLALTAAGLLPSGAARLQDLAIQGKQSVYRAEPLQFDAEETHLSARLKLFETWDEYDSIELEAGSVYKTPQEAFEAGIREIGILKDMGIDLLPAMESAEGEAYAMMTADSESGVPFVIWDCEVRLLDGTEVGAILDETTGKILILAVENQVPGKMQPDPEAYGQALAEYYGFLYLGTETTGGDGIQTTRFLFSDGETEFYIRGIVTEESFGFNVPEITDYDENMGVQEKI